MDWEITITSGVVPDILLGSKIVQFRKDNRLSRDELAKEVGTS